MFDMLKEELSKIFMVIKNKKKENSETILEIVTSCLRVIGLWPHLGSSERIAYKCYNVVISCLLLMFALTISCDLYAASSDFEILGDDICVLVGIYLILYKTFCYRYRINDIEKLIYFFNKIYRDTFNKCLRVRKKMTFYILQDILLLIGNIIMGFALFVAVCFQPFFAKHNENILPFRAKFPFSTKEGAGYIAAYIFQSFSTLLIIEVIVFLDSLGCMFLNQTCLHIEILCEKFRRFGSNKIDDKSLEDELRSLVREHQNIISLVDSINQIFRPMFMAQVVASMSIICLTAFEASLTFHNKSSFFKFFSYMSAAFMQLLYWCWVGNKINYQSAKLSDAVYESNWLFAKNQIKRDLQFVILRAQKPLMIKTAPLYDLNFVSFINILSGSYSYFTLLRTLNQ